ncbi:MAG: hypothetical protein M0R30_01290 [Methanoregula sp.]|uniref:hypothetical protein n=1 Tax=Methanoregula sp. TaxID=2052170 RepID=UPI0025F6A521|nr:hypothetical protein [Methanoregula sp.]MCK9630249.1 hypothetical protein [Methanoregula sp.]
MTDIIMPDYIFAVFLFAFCALIVFSIGRNMNDHSNMKHTQKLKNNISFSNFDSSEKITIVLGIAMIVAVLIFFLGLFQLNSIIPSITSETVKQDINALMLSFFGLGLAMFAMCINFLFTISNGAISRLRHEEVIGYLKKIPSK